VGQRGAGATGGEREGRQARSGRDDGETVQGDETR
jgi:hypothetical protein